MIDFYKMKIVVMVDGESLGTFNVSHTSTTWFLLNEGIKFLPLNTTNSYKVSLNVTQTGPSVPYQVFSDSRYTNTTIESLYYQMVNPTLLFINSIGSQDFEVTYKLTPRIPIPPEESKEVYRYTIDSLYRGHSFSYFTPEEDRYEQDTDGSIKMSSLLYRNDEELMLYKEPPSFIEEVTYYNTNNTGVKIVWDATLIRKKAFNDN